MFRIFVHDDPDGSITAAIRSLEPSRDIAVVRDLAAELPAIEVLVAGFPPREGWAGAKRLRLLQLMGAGVDMLLPSPDLPAEVEVATLRGVFAREAAEHAMALILSLCRTLGAIRDRQNEHVWHQFATDTIGNKTLGVIGMGSIGKRIARAAEALEMRTMGVRSDHTRAELEAMLRASNFLVVSAPLTAKTRNLIGERELALLPLGAYVVNIARGGIVDEVALVRALESGHLGGAALDVCEREPLAKDDPLWSVPNLIITPHVAGFGLRYVERMAAVLLANVGRLERGEPRQLLVDRARGY